MKLFLVFLQFPSDKKRFSSMKNIEKENKEKKM